MKNIYVTADKPEDWRKLLADPIKHWRSGYSAKALAYSWQNAKGFPTTVKKVFKKSDIDIFQDIEPLIALPEYKVHLPGGPRASQNDIFVLAKGKGQLIAIAVEGKVSEDFASKISKWKYLKDAKTNKPQRLAFLLKTLKLEGKDIDTLRYQLLHRTASAFLEAKKFNAKNAVMLVHSFSQTYEHFEDYEQFLKLFGLRGKKDTIVGPVKIDEINLYFGWVRGDKRYLMV